MSSSLESNQSAYRTPNSAGPPSSAPTDRDERPARDRRPTDRDLRPARDGRPADHNVRPTDRNERPTGGPDADTGASAAPLSDRHSVVAREKERFGGIKWGAALFGWLTATGTAVILTALLVAAGAAVGVANDTDATDAAGQVSDAAGTIGVVGAIALLVVLLIAYYCGGYVAGRMARFNGMKQGIAVWVWAVAIAVVVAVTGALLGSEFDILDKVGGFPRLPVSDNATTGGVVAIVIALVAALLGAVLGGLAGMRFHRRVDKAGLGH